MFGQAAHHRSLIAKPLRQHFSIGHGCFPIAEYGTDLGSMALPGTIGCSEAVMRRTGHAELLGYLGDSAWLDFLGLIRKSAMCSVKQQQQGEVHPVRLALGHDEHKIRGRQRPTIEDVRSGNSQFAKLLSSAREREVRVFAEMRLQKYPAKGSLNARTFARLCRTTRRCGSEDRLCACLNSRSETGPSTEVAECAGSA